MFLGWLGMLCMCYQECFLAHSWCCVLVTTACLFFGHDFHGQVSNTNNSFRQSMPQSSIGHHFCVVCRLGCVSHWLSSGACLSSLVTTTSCFACACCSSNCCYFSSTSSCWSCLFLCTVAVVVLAKDIFISLVASMNWVWNLCTYIKWWSQGMPERGSHLVSMSTLNLL